MRNIVCFESFCTQLERRCVEILGENLLRTSVIDSPTFFEDYEQNLILPRTLPELIALSILLYYIEEVQFRLELRIALERVSYFKENFVLRILLKSKIQMLTFLYDTNLWSSNELFGNILPFVKEKEGEEKKQQTLLLWLKTVRFRKRNKKVSKPKRKRGYDDKGSLRLPHTKKPTYDWSLTELQNHIEQERESSEATADFISGWLE